ncbi:MAG TPA: flagellar motor switch protein FliG [Candidatus Baltobacteraceae bacterium]|jgi:flagellar motor switch protein FliG|nr:flagellar motor switch protein FliG [Candidatus Baltobacteraceae bacterium]
MERADKATSGLKKAAILVVLLGDEAAAALYKHLSDPDLRLLTQEIAELGYVSPETASQVLQEYHRLTMTQEYLAQGGPDYATKVLVKAFGESGANNLLDQVVQAQEAGARNLDTLQKADPAQLAKFIQGEHPQTIALVLAHLSPKTASIVLNFLSEKTRANVVKRLAQMQQFSPEVVQQISVVLHKKMEAVCEQSSRSYGGITAVSEMMNRLDPQATKNILETIESEDAQLAVAIRNSMFTFEDLVSVPDTGIRELLGQVDKKILATAMKGTAEELKNHLMKAMSSRAAEMLKEDIEALGPMRSRDVLHAQREIVTLARKLEAEGKMTLKSDGEEAYVV